MATPTAPEPTDPTTEPDTGKHADSDTATVPDSGAYGNGGVYPAAEFNQAQADIVEADPTLKSRGA